MHVIYCSKNPITHISYVKATAAHIYQLQEYCFLQAFILYNINSKKQST